MDDPKNLIELRRHEYRSGGIKGEPIFGPGWPIGLAALTTIVVGTLVHEASAPVYILGAIGGGVIGAIAQQFYR